MSTEAPIVVGDLFEEKDFVAEIAYSDGSGEVRDDSDLASLISYLTERIVKIKSYKLFMLGDNKVKIPLAEWSNL